MKKEQGPPVFLRKLLGPIIHWWEKYRENEKWKEFYSRLDRNKEGRFNWKQHQKDLQAGKKNARKIKRGDK